MHNWTPLITEPNGSIIAQIIHVIGYLSHSRASALVRGGAGGGGGLSVHVSVPWLRGFSMQDVVLSCNPSSGPSRV